MTEDELDKFRREDPAFEERLLKALSIDLPELPVPDLPDLELSNVTPVPRRIAVARAAWFALAATVAVAVFISQRPPVEAISLEQQVLAHIDHEPGAFRVTDRAVSDERLAGVLPASIATLGHESGLITYAMTCHINGNPVPHLVVQGERGPVTILLMPEEEIDGPRTIDGQGVHGVILPVGDGSVAIVGSKDEALERLQQRVLESVNWAT